MKIYKDLPEGNAFNIMAQVSRFLKARGRQSEVEKVLAEMSQQPDYEHLCQVAERVTDNEITIIR